MTQALNIVVLGLPGAGKGTQSRKISKDFGLFYFEAGDFLRNLAKRDRRIKDLIVSGGLIPDENMNRMVFNYLGRGRKYEKGILFDGYPRSVYQYKELVDWLSEKGKKIDLIFFFDVPVEEAVRRLSARRVCPICGRIYNLITDPPKIDVMCDVCKIGLNKRDDDLEDIVRERFKRQKKTLLPLIDFLGKESNFYRIDASQPIKEVYADVEEVIRKYGEHYI